MRMENNINNEIWKNITLFPNYQVSNLGRVRNLITNNILKGGLIQDYKRVTLSNDTIKTSKKVHCLVAIEFLGYIFNAKDSVINHIDGDKTNNKLDNLEVVTQRENVSECFKSNKSKNTSKYIGVNFHKASNKWISQIHINGKNKYLGIYNTEIEAHNKYNEELNKIK